MTHTPGPWKVAMPDDESPRLNKYPMVVRGYNRHFSVVGNGIADARLIAAAPDLLEVLEEAREFVDAHSEPWYKPGQELLSRIDNTINKAKGA